MAHGLQFGLRRAVLRCTSNRPGEKLRMSGELVRIPLDAGEAGSTSPAFFFDIESEMRR